MRVGTCRALFHAKKIASKETLNLIKVHGESNSTQHMYDTGIRTAQYNVLRNIQPRKPCDYWPNCDGMCVTCIAAYKIPPQGRLHHTLMR